MGESGQYTFAAQPDLSFILTAGDQVNSSDNEKALEEYNAFRSPAALRQIPVTINIGNHESNTDLLDSQFDRLKNGSDFYYDYGDILFYSLNCMNTDTQAHLDKLSQTITRHKPRGSSSRCTIRSLAARIALRMKRSWLPARPMRRLFLT